MKILAIENAKTTLGESLGYLTGIIYLAPHSIARRGVNLCPGSSAGCRKSCLYFAGRGAFKSIQQARIKKTLWFLDDLSGFKAQLRKDILALERKAKRLGMKPAVRLNGTSDIRWELVAPELFTEFSHIQFYDYTKIPGRVVPANYHLTLSASEKTSASEIAASLHNYAVVFSGDTLPKRFAGKSVIDGLAHDLRFLDKRNSVVGLLPKGRAKKDNSGFVRH